MKFTVKNLGPIKDAEVQLGDLTVVCGKNNNGKTYLTYTLHSFLDTIEKNLEIPINDSVVTELMRNGIVEIDLLDYVDDYVQNVRETLPRFRDTLPRFLVVNPDVVARSIIDLDLTSEMLRKRLIQESKKSCTTIHSNVRITASATITFERNTESTHVRVSLLNRSDKIPPREIFQSAMSFFVAHLINATTDNRYFPDAFIITCERTGAVLFRPEIIVAREAKASRVRGDKGSSDDPCHGYQRPVERDLQFVLGLKNVVSKKSFIAERHPDIVRSFGMLAGGSYRLDTGLNQVRYMPTAVSLPESQRGGLSLAEASSTVRSLSELYFYLMHMAERGQLLMLDEPELNLHPESQRMLAHVLIRLVNAGLKVFITTHSDYIVREINAMVAVSGLPDKQRNSLLGKFGYDESDLIDGSRIKGYVLADGYTHEITRTELGSLAIGSFDDTMGAFSRLYSDILIGLAGASKNNVEGDGRVAHPKS